MGTCNSQQNKLAIKLITGDALSQQLFDHHTTNLCEVSNTLIFPSSIIKKGYNLNYQNQYQYQRDNSLIKINMLDNKQINMEIKYPQKYSIWKTIKYYQNQLIQQNDIIKIGKIQLKIKQINKYSQTKYTANTLQSQIMQNTIISHQSTQYIKQQQCRICFDNYDTDSNPLLSICKCIGSIKYIHLSCLKDWLLSNITKRQTSSCISYCYISPKCDLCKQQLQIDFTYRKKNYKLIDLDTFYPPYMILQNKQIQQNGQIRNYLYIIKLIDGQEIIIGRNNTSDIILKDISVSRNHCSILYKNQLLYINDKQSKFGTLVKFKRKIGFNSLDGIQLQFQNQLIQIYQSQYSHQTCCCTNYEYYTISTNYSDS